VAVHCFSSRKCVGLLFDMMAITSSILPLFDWGGVLFDMVDILLMEKLIVGSNNVFL
jgi:hypothetical protein